MTKIKKFKKIAISIEGKVDKVKVEYTGILKDLWPLFYKLYYGYIEVYFIINIYDDILVFKIFFKLCRHFVYAIMFNFFFQFSLFCQCEFSPFQKFDIFI